MLGRSEHRRGAAALDDYSLIHEHDLGGHLSGKGHLVSHDDERHSIVRKLTDRQKDFVDQFRVQGRRDLVEEHHLGLHCQGAGDRRALLLAAGKVRGIGTHFVRESDVLQQFDRPFVGDGSVDTKDLARGEGDVVENGQLREQSEMLEHHPQAQPQRPEIRTYLDLAAAIGTGEEPFSAHQQFTLIRALEPDQEPAQRALSRAARSDDRHTSTSGNDKVDASNHLVGTKELPNSASFDSHVGGRRWVHARGAVRTTRHGVD